jgi:CBS domain-containing protein
MRQIADVDGLTAADLMHRRLTTLPATATVRELRAYFAESESHRLALIVDGDRYVGAVAAGALGGAADDASAAELARAEPVVRAGAPAAEAQAAALADPSSRLPVVDDAGRLVGIVAINRARDGFCGTS